MAKRMYGQFCGLVRALEMVGERWALLIVRDLLTGPKRFTDLHRGLPRIPTNVLAARLVEMEEHGVVQRRVLPRPAAAVVYELTEYGQQLEDVVLALGRWGAQRLGEPRPDEIVTVDSVTMALRSTFRPAAARRLNLAYELRVGDVVLDVRVRRGRLDVSPGSAPGADLVIDSGPGIRALMAGEISPAEARRTGVVRIEGDPALLDRFVEVFHIPTVPTTASA
jgi:DNA-binding HxlR family transcriptional regulator